MISGRSRPTESDEELVVRHPVGGPDSEDASDRIAKMRLGSTFAVYPPRNDTTLDAELARKCGLRHPALIELLLEQGGSPRA